MSKNTKITVLAALLPVLVVLTATGEIFGVPSAHAAGLTDSIISGASVGIGVFITVLNFLMWVLFILLGIVTNPATVFPARVGEVLFNLWQVFRDLVNIAFALLLIAGAIMTVVTASTERVKTMLPKFVMAVILVNFSWFIPQVIYDIASVTTYTVYQLPTWIGRTTPNAADCYADKTRTKKCQVVTNFVFFEEIKKQNITTGVDGWDCTANILCVQTRDFDDPAVTARMDKQAILFNGLIINYAKLRTLATLIDAGRIADAEGAGIGTLLVWLVKISMVLVIHIALFFPILALVFAFFIRIPILWLTMAFMPFVALGFVVDQLSWIIEKVGKQFVKAAFLPAIVGVPFAIGFIMLNVASSIELNPGDPLAIKVPFIAGIDTFWELLWLALCLGILWVGVFAALKEGGEYVNHFTDTIKGMGEAAGRGAAKLPLIAPIIPTGIGGGKTNLLSMGRTIDPRNIEQGINRLGNPVQFGQQQAVHQDINQKLDQNAVTQFTNQTRSIANSNTHTQASNQALLNQLRDMQNHSNQLQGQTLTHEQVLEGYILRMGNALNDTQKANLRMHVKPPPAPAAPPPTTPHP